ncbi:GNAT family N-acetyltransferase [Patescibacteria group bacterium]
MLTIRDATIEDLEDIKKLNTKIFSSNIKWDKDTVENFASTKQGEKYYTEALQRKDGCFFVCEEDGEMVGYANGGDKKEIGRKSRYFELDNVGVIPERLKQGIGKELLNKVNDWAKEKGFQKIYLNCYFANKGAIKFYKKAGYKEIDICLEKEI